MRVLIAGPNEAARVALFRATAGVWPSGEGRTVRPPLDAIFFLPQQPYLTPGTLRQLLVDPAREKEFTDEHILAAIRDAGLESVVVRVGGLDDEHDWPTVLSLGEQQQLVIVRLILARPSFALLDRVSTTLALGQLQQSLRRLSDNSITYIEFGEAGESNELYDAVLEIDPGGAWSWRQTSAAGGG
jgi:putative ATP-binding cassette transporter